jgi:hypothetical protein
MVCARDMKIHQQMAASRIDSGTMTIISVLLSMLSVCHRTTATQTRAHTTSNLLRPAPTQGRVS